MMMMGESTEALLLRQAIVHAKNLERVTGEVIDTNQKLRRELNEKNAQLRRIQKLLDEVKKEPTNFREDQSTMNFGDECKASMPDEMVDKCDNQKGPAECCPTCGR